MHQKVDPLNSDFLLNFLFCFMFFFDGEKYDIMKPKTENSTTEM